MKISKTYLVNKDIPIIYEHNKITSTNLIIDNEQYVYQFDFPQSKRTILITNKSYQYETIPPFSVLLFTYNRHWLFVGEINNDNLIVGTKINGYKIWACGTIFFKNITDPENDIDHLIKIYWMSDFPYYNNFTYGKFNNKIIKSAINLNQLKQIS